MMIVAYFRRAKNVHILRYYTERAKMTIFVCSFGIVTGNMSYLFVISEQLATSMMITPNSRAHKGEKQRGEVKGEYGGI